MAFTEKHMYITVMGDGYNATEQWQFGFRALMTDPTLQPTQATADGIGGEVDAWWSGTAPYAVAGPFCRLTRLVQTKVSWVDTTGLLVPNSLVRIHLPAAPIAGKEAPAADHHAWPQNSEAATLLTALPRGRGSKGRVFLPPACSTMDSTGRMSSGTIDGLSTQFALLLSRINLLPAVNAVAVMSKVGAGSSQFVTQVSVGSVMDTQRRRRRSLAETPAAVHPVTQ